MKHFVVIFNGTNYFFSKQFLKIKTRFLIFILKQANSVNLYPHQIGSGWFIVYFKFHKILFTGYLVMARLWILNQIKGSESSGWPHIFSNQIP